MPTPARNRSSKTSALHSSAHFSSQAASGFTPRLQAIVLVVLSLLVYAQTLRYGFVLDDGLVMSDNRFVQRGVAGIPEIFSQGSFAGNRDFGANDMLSGGRYRPLSLMMFALEWQLTGGSPVFAPMLAHALNVVLNALVVLVLFWLVRDCGAWLEPRLELVPFCVALLFALHPAHTEVVANIKSRDEILSLLFSLMAMRFYLRAAVGLTADDDAASTLSKRSKLSKLSRLSKHSLVWMTICFALALFSKESAVAFLVIMPCVGLLLHSQLRARPANTSTNASAASTSATPLVAFFSASRIPNAVLVLLVVGFVVLRSAIVGVVDARTGDDVFTDPFFHATLGQRGGLIASVLLRYVVSAVFPFTLSHDYGYNAIPRVELWHWQSLAGIAVMALLVGGAVWLMARAVRAPRVDRVEHEAHSSAIHSSAIHSSATHLSATHSSAVAESLHPALLLVCMGIWWYLAAIALVANIVVNLGGVMGDRFLYAPSIGAALALVGAWHWYWSSRQQRNNRDGKRGNNHDRLLLLATLVLAGLYGIRTLVRVPAWESLLTLLQADVQSVPQSIKVRDRLAIALLTQATNEPNASRRAALAQEAYTHLRSALAIDSSVSTTTHNTLADYYGRFLGQHETALASYRSALRIKPNDSATWCNLYVSTATLAFQNKQPDSAIAAFQRALDYERSPSQERRAQLLSNIAFLHMQQRDTVRARSTYQRALALPNLAAQTQQRLQTELRQLDQRSIGR
jgi:protein O-mannosyl-transferase